MRVCIRSIFLSVVLDRFVLINSYALGLLVPSFDKHRKQEARQTCPRVEDLTVPEALCHQCELRLCPAAFPSLLAFGLDEMIDAANGDLGVFDRA